MKGIAFEGSSIIGAGDNPNTEDLHVRLYTDPGIDFQIEQENLGKPEEEKKAAPAFLISCFELSEPELATLAATKKLWLHIMCHPQHPTMPPVSLSPYNPEQLGFKPVNPTNEAQVTETPEESAE
jgi:hypothetical protein